MTVVPDVSWFGMRHHHVRLSVMASLFECHGTVSVTSLMCLYLGGRAWIRLGSKLLAYLYGGGLPVCCPYDACVPCGRRDASQPLGRQPIAVMDSILIAGVQADASLAGSLLVAVRLGCWSTVTVVVSLALCH